MIELQRSHEITKTQRTPLPLWFPTPRQQQIKLHSGEESNEDMHNDDLPSTSTSLLYTGKYKHIPTSYED